VPPMSDFDGLSVPEDRKNAMAGGHGAAPRPWVWIVVLWGEDVLSVSHVRPGQRYRLGEAPGALPLPEGLLGTPALTLVTHDSPSPRLRVPAKVNGWFSAPASAPVALDELRSASSSPSIIEQPLVVGAQAMLELGAFTVLVQCTMPGPELRRGSDPDWRWRTSLAATAIAGISALFALSRAIPELGDTELDTTEPEWLFEVHSPADVMGEEDPAEPPPTIALQPNDLRYSILGGRCGDLYDMGGLRHGNKSNRYGLEGPRDNPDPHLANARGPRVLAVREISDRRRGATDPNAGADRDPSGITAPWGRDTSLGTDEVSAQGSMWGDEIGPAEGRNTLGRVSEEGGLVKRIALGVALPDGEPMPPRVVHTGLLLNGPLELSEVEKTIAPRFTQLRGCYQAGLDNAPKLAGRADIQFVIAKNGSTRDVHTPHATLADREVVSCLEAGFRGLAFPASAGGETTVTYPLFFVPGNPAAAAHALPTPLEGAVIHVAEVRPPCGGVRQNSPPDDVGSPAKPKPCPK
jgi:hypothetical protein